jgi:hypothetical protein
MSKSVELLLKFLDEKACKLQENDYLQGCNILKELYREHEKFSKYQNSINVLTHKIIALEDKVKKIDRKINKYDSNEELLNILYLRVESMGECLNELGALNSGIQYVPSISKDYHGKEDRIRAFKGIKSRRRWNF